MVNPPERDIVDVEQGADNDGPGDGDGHRDPHNARDLEALLDADEEEDGVDAEREDELAEEHPLQGERVGAYGGKADLHQLGRRGRGVTAGWRGGGGVAADGESVGRGGVF